MKTDSVPTPRPSFSPSPRPLCPPHGVEVSTVIRGEQHMAYVPSPLSSLPPPDWGALIPMLGRANRSVGALRGIRHLLPNPDYFLEGCIQREALFSSQIEGIRSSFDDLLLDESDKRMPGSGKNSQDDDLVETFNCADALKSSVDYLRVGVPGSSPLPLHLLRTLHAKLLQSGRGMEKKPGEFRNIQNWIGNYIHFIHIPPPPDKVEECMEKLEEFVAESDGKPDPLIRAGMAHAQFECIHPFRDGNGRMGRLLIVLMLINEGVLDAPWLYISLPIKRRRREYYDQLQSTRTTGDWTNWLLYFLQVITEAAENVRETAHEADQLFRRDNERIAKEIGVQSRSVAAVHKALQLFPISSIPRLEKEAKFSQPSIKSALDRLAKIGIVRPFDNRSWRKRYVYHEYLEILRRDGEPL